MIASNIVIVCVVHRDKSSEARSREIAGMQKCADTVFLLSPTTIPVTKAAVWLGGCVLQGVGSVACSPTWYC
jgi:hypothetical protein